MAESHFTDRSMIRIVHRERAVGLGGPRALLMMAADPVAFEGFFRSTGSLDEPYERLRRTGVVMDTITFGPKQRAARMTRHVREAHARVRGVLPEEAGPFPAGTPYAADDPELLLWVLAALVDSCILAYTRYVRGLSAEELDAYWKDFRIVGRHFGLRAQDMPRSWGELREHVDGMVDSERIFVTPTARELGIDIVMRPPAPTLARPLVELVNQITIGWLPEPVRRGYGFSWDPARGLAVRAQAEYVRRVLVPLLPGSLRLVPSAQAA